VLVIGHDAIVEMGPTDEALSFVSDR